jgi:phospholipid/cholesterol/gamma-HCH transport system ATP-binding protein
VLLKLVLGLIRPDRGSIVFEGRDLTRLAERDLREVRRRMGMVFQGGALFDSLTVFENVAYGLTERGWPDERIRTRVRQCLGLVDLAATERLLPEQLSGGMKKRIAIARAIAPEPELMFYDEPTTGLDPKTARAITELIRALAERLHTTALLVTHDMECVYRAADRIALLEEGRVGWTGDARAAEEAPSEPLRRFLGEDASWSNVEVSP